MTNKDQALIMKALRDYSRMWPAKAEAVRAATTKRGYRKCAMCKKEFHHAETQVDHVEPVIKPETGFTTWDEYINRLFVETKGWQVLCKPCHRVKTNAENERRAEIRAIKRRSK